MDDNEYTVFCPTGRGEMSKASLEEAGITADVIESELLAGLDSGLVYVMRNDDQPLNLPMGQLNLVPPFTC
jgi:hypothetical protein